MSTSLNVSATDVAALLAGEQVTLAVGLLGSGALFKLLDAGRLDFGVAGGRTVFVSTTSTSGDSRLVRCSAVLCGRMFVYVCVRESLVAF